ncbi:hypothetical protein CPB85DRAFT_997143 [Mucidula mucida]|nr:hypothetical protein CPB85DRAFT_997143 [Mucidula mucida]
MVRLLLILTEVIVLSFQIPTPCFRLQDPLRKDICLPSKFSRRRPMCVDEQKENDWKSSDVAGDSFCGEVYQIASTLMVKGEMNKKHTRVDSNNKLVRQPACQLGIGRQDFLILQNKLNEE